MEQLNNLVIVDHTTGEICGVDDIYAIARQEVSENQRKKNEAFRNMLLEHENLSSDRFVTCDDEEVLRIITHLTFKEAGAVMRLLAFISLSEDGRLKDERGGTLTQEGIKNIIGVSERQAKEYIKKFKELGLLQEVGKDGRFNIYAFNPLIHSRRGVNKGYFTKIWLSNLREKWIDLPLEPLGFLYKVMPFFNTYSCCLTANPYELDVAESIPFASDALADIMGEDLRAVRKNVNFLSRKGLVLTFNVGRARMMCVNPVVMYRKPVRNGEDVPRDYELLFKQAEFVQESVDGILAKKREVRKSNKILH